MKMKGKLIIGAILAILASASWGSMYPIAESALVHIDPFYFALVRYIPIAIIFSVVLFIVEGKAAFRSEGNFVHIIFFGIMGFTVYNLFIFWGQHLLGGEGVILASVMESLSPVISILVIWIVYRQKVHKFTIVVIIGAFIGVLLVITKGEMSSLLAFNRLIPLLILLIAAGGWAFYTIGGSRFPDWSVLRYSTLSVIYGTIISTLVILVISAMGLVPIPKLEAIYDIRFHIIYMILIPGLLSILLWNQAVVFLKPINTILFINVAPITTIIIQAIQGHAISHFELIGVAIVCLMIVLNNLHQRWEIKRRKASDAEIEDEAQLLNPEDY
ncbi:DMT family transporter [Sporosarcina saromensis]|uniref:DMT family transporter n=1 Tax=Sporosarcina saromensis TaxID=359365 RepID=A0ABU4GBW2_9BACL|nr:DMT family transporter [Sporosarcina saromensis]MDW0113077.1 DMT family transporter [Sporosarcina saromensis]